MATNPLTASRPGAGPVVIETGDVTPTDNLAKYYNDGSDVAIYADFRIRNRFEKDKHIYMLPVASPNGFQGASVAFVQLASPTLLWICDWTACRFNVQPNIPDPTPTDLNWIVLDEHYEPATITVGPDGVTPLYRISGTYVYGHRNPSPTTINNINFARPPWLQDSFNRFVPADKLQQGLSNVISTGPVGFPTR